MFVFGRDANSVDEITDFVTASDKLSLSVIISEEIRADNFSLAHVAGSVTPAQLKNGQAHVIDTSQTPSQRRVSKR